MSDREIDQQLVERVQRGDKQAFGLLVSKYQRKLQRLLSRLIRDPAEARKLTDEYGERFRALDPIRAEPAAQLSPGRFQGKPVRMWPRSHSTPAKAPVAT